MHMFRDEKYIPKALITYCPVCDHQVDADEWRDYGMHLHCTEFHYTRQCVDQLCENNDERFDHLSDK